MSNYKLFDGINWVDICKCNVHVKTITEWKKLDPWNCTTKYWDGANWCEIICCECPAGYVYDPKTRDCYKLEIISATPSGGTTVPIVNGSTSPSYATSGTRLYEDISSKVFPLNGWQNDTVCTTCANGYQVFENSGTGPLVTIQSTLKIMFR